MDRKRGAYQDQQAKGLNTLDELRAKLAASEETRSVAHKQLQSLKGRRERLECLEHDADALLEHYAKMVPKALDDLASEERHAIYKMLRLRVVVSAISRWRSRACSVVPWEQRLPVLRKTRFHRDVHPNMVERLSCASAHC